jgi:hypothetical protein
MDGKKRGMGRFKAETKRRMKERAVLCKPHAAFVGLKVKLLSNNSLKI